MVGESLNCSLMGVWSDPAFGSLLNQEWKRLRAGGLAKARSMTPCLWRGLGEIRVNLHQQATGCLRRLLLVSGDRCQGAFSPHTSHASSCLAYPLEPPEAPCTLWMLSGDVNQGLRTAQQALARAH